MSAYVALMAVCFFAQSAYRTRAGEGIAIVSALFFGFSVIAHRIPEFDSEIILYASINFALFWTLAELRAHRYLLTVCFFGFLSHGLGYSAYILDLGYGLVVYNTLTYALSVVYVLLLLALSDAGMDRLSQVIDILKSCLLRLGKG